MKRVIIALSMLIFAAASAFIFTMLLSRNITAISADVSRLGAVSQTATHDTIVNETDIIITKWNKTQKFLKVFTVHESLNEINRNILLLGEISADGNRERLYEKCREICIMLSVFQDDEKASAENIF